MPKFLNNIDLQGNELQNAVLQVISGSNPSSPAPAVGRIFYDGNSNQIKVFTGTVWESLATAIDETEHIFDEALKIGRDADNLIDFTTDNKVVFRVAGVDEMELVANALQPTTTNGIALGTSSLMWSDLFLASGGVVNFNNGNMTLTHSNNTLTFAGGTTATAALTTSTIVASGVIKTDSTTNASTTTDGSLQTDGGLSVAKDAVIGDNLKLITDGSVLNMGVHSDFTITHDGTTGATLAGNPVNITAGGASTWKATAGSIAIDSEAGAVLLDGHTGVAIASATGEIDITAGAGVDINANSVTVDSTTGVSIDAGDDSNITVGGNGKTLDIDASGALTIDSATSIAIGANADKPINIDSSTLDIGASGAITIDSTSTISIDGANDVNLSVTSSTTGEDLTIQQIGANDSSIIITAAGTGADAVSIDATAGGMLIAPNLADGQTLKLGKSGAAEMIIAPHGTPADEKIQILNTSGTADTAIKIESTVGGLYLKAGDDSLYIDADGTDADALVLTSAGGIDITSAGVAKDIDITATGGTVNINATENAANAIHLHTNGGASETIKIHSDQGTGAGSIELTSDGGSIDINAGDNITMDAADDIALTTTSANGLITLHSAHTAGDAVHIDANAHAGSILNIDAGILDIDVQGAAELTAASWTVHSELTRFTSSTSAKPVVDIKNTTNDTNGAVLKFTKDKGAAGADGDIIGQINFDADDAAQTITTFGRIISTIASAADTDEAGKLELYVATSNGTDTGLDAGLTLTGSSTTADEVNVTLGKGPASIVTIPGNLTVTGTTTTNNVETINTTNGVQFEGSTADGHDAILSSVVADSDKTYVLPNLSGYVAILQNDPGTTTLSSTVAELNFLNTIPRGSILFGDNGGATAELAAGAENYVLTSDGTDISWATPGTAGSIAADNITAGDAAVSIATSTGNVTVDSNAGSVTIDGHTGVTLQSTHSGDITLDSVADIVLDAGGNDINFKAGGTHVLSVTNSSSDVIIKPIVDGKDIIFQQRDGTEVARVEDNGTFNVVTDKLAISGTAITSSATELNFNDGVTLGTATASKVVTTDASKNTTGQNNLTITGELDAATGDFSGIIDVAGVATVASLVCTAAATFGGGYGNTGATISNAGIGTFNGALTTDGVLTGNSLVCTLGATFGGGYGSTGATISAAGVGQFNGALTTSAALTADNIVCTNAITIGGGTGSTGATISTAGVGTFDGDVTVLGYNVALAKSFVLDHDTTDVAAAVDGDTDSLTFTITHRFPATFMVKAEILTNSGNYDTVFADVTRPTNGTVLVTFATAVANGDYVALLTRVG